MTGTATHGRRDAEPVANGRSDLARQWVVLVSAVLATAVSFLLGWAAGILAATDGSLGFS